ncbi:IspD/TarI family cytidylyltransferase [Oribacterium sp. WCC10]|uniref:IspD/TarI family cytidylyltransferase n=1 Tax=Oribacterium sp. WCC10 TaxID=1855343 RepID=UPI0008E09293|nr:IspD/TarI family cytidylyltransferase [Oribacterium sp. WCC10]SFG25736.1 2-C-methyl-D-erythritol 4-phosphate cytidylyltransferase [Oribacterium sp. WCC10]
MLRALLLSGGKGTRLGEDIPKQYIKVNGRMIIEYSMETLLSCNEIDSLTIVADPEWRDEILKVLEGMKCSEKFQGFADPGETRQLSIYNGLLIMKDNVFGSDAVLIHDAARPRLKANMIKEMIKAFTDSEGVMPVIPMKDTVYVVDDSGKLKSLLERKNVVAGQAPELFLFSEYLKANEKMIKAGRMESINGSTEPAFLSGMDITTIPGDEDNFKITTKEDLERFRGLMEN